VHRESYALYLQPQQNAIRTLARVAPDAVIQPIIGHSVQVLNNPAFRVVTRDEFALMMWPEGDLFDKSVIEALVFYCESSLCLYCILDFNHCAFQDIFCNVLQSHLISSVVCMTNTC
jgi:hypothetical protein